MKWTHDPARGQLEAYVPQRALWGTSPVKLEVEGPDTGCWFADDHTLLCKSTSAGPKRVKARPCLRVFGVCL